MKLKHIKPTIKYKEKAISYVNEFKENNSKIHGGGSITWYIEESSYEMWLKELDRRKSYIPDEKRVPEETYFLVDEDDLIVGMINIRLTLNDRLKEIGGHIGYSIRPTKRGLGYNKINLYLGLKRLQKEGVKEALLDCSKDNLPSSGTMKALGGKLVKEHYDDYYGDVEDYVFDIDSVIEKYKDIYDSQIDWENNES